jgi:hypothetical protein
MPTESCFDLNTPDGGRGYIANLFKTVLKRHDYRQYIAERLAGDFACTLAQHFERITAERDALQLRLNAADQRIDELTAIPQRGAENEPPTYKPGLYAVRHIDNWDGERDVALTFAQLDADGKWTDNETGDALLTYRGDKILRAWPLDCSDAPDTQIIGVPRDWLQDWALELVESAQDGGQMSNQVEHLLEVHSKP